LTASVTPAGVLLLDHRRQTAIEGPATAATAGRLLRVAVDPLLLPDVARGGLRRTAPPWAPTTAANGEDAGLWWFESGDWRAGVDPDSRRLRRLTVGRGDPLTVTWRDWRDFDHAAAACRLEVARPAQRQTMTLQLGDVQINQSIDPTLLRPAVPAGWRTQRLDEADRSGE
jgi:hypothetical protein